LTPIDQLHHANDQLQADSELLGEVLDYLLRMPVTHPTLSIARKVKERIEDPTRRAAQLKATRDARTAGLRSGLNFSPSGAPVIEAELDGDVLRLWTPDIFKTESEKAEWNRMLIKRLQNTETLQLTPGAATYIARMQD
jgi:hypothetical protein